MFNRNEASLALFVFWVHHIYLCSEKISFFFEAQTVAHILLLFYDISSLSLLSFFFLSFAWKEKKTANKWKILNCCVSSASCRSSKYKNIKVAQQHSFRLNGKSFLDLLVDNPKKKKLSKEETRKISNFFLFFSLWKATRREQIFLLLLLVLFCFSLHTQYLVKEEKYWV